MLGEDGTITPLSSDETSRALFMDERLRNRNAQIVGRRFAGVPYLQVVTIQVESEGRLRTPEYFCEVCTISVRYPQICPCCQGNGTSDEARTALDRGGASSRRDSPACRPRKSPICCWLLVATRGASCRPSAGSACVFWVTRSAQESCPITLRRSRSSSRSRGSMKSSSRTSAAFFQLDYPCFQLLFCVADVDDPAIEVVRS